MMMIGGGFLVFTKDLSPSKPTALESQGSLLVFQVYTLMIALKSLRMLSFSPTTFGNVLALMMGAKVRRLLLDDIYPRLQP